MSNKLKIEREIKMFLDLGVDADLTHAIVYKKYGYDDVASESLENIKAQNEDIAEALKDLVPFETTVEFINSNEMAQKERISLTIVDGNDRINQD